MKKIIIFITVFIFCFCISGCSNDNQKTTWNMEYIQGKDGEVIYCSKENKNIYPNADIKNIICILEKKHITIRNKDTGEEWMGSCKKIGKDNKSIIYEVKFDDNKTGNLVKSFTKYENNTQHDTLIISSGEYSLNLTIQ